VEQVGIEPTRRKTTGLQPARTPLFHLLHNQQDSFDEHVKLKVWCSVFIAEPILNLVPQYGIEPQFDAYKATVIAIILQGQFWRKAEESNPIPFLRTQFSRLVAAPTQLHYFPKSFGGDKWYRSTLLGL
jgi:hypothetical protein